MFGKLPRWERWTCVALQMVSLFAYWGVVSLPFVLLLLLARALRHGDITFASAAGLATVAGFAAWPAMLALSIALKWLVIGRYKPGRHPVWGLYYFRWWLVNLFQTLSWSGMFVGTPLMSLYFRLMGARVGRSATIDTPFCSIFDLVSIGDNTSIGSETHILGYRIEDGELSSAGSRSVQDASSAWNAASASASAWEMARCSTICRCSATAPRCNRARRGAARRLCRGTCAWRSLIPISPATVGAGCSALSTWASSMRWDTC